jgi:hypothetical protein
MLSDIVSLFLAIVGVVFILFSVLFKLMVWKENGVSISIPLKSDDEEIYNRIKNLREICSFLGIQKQCTIVVVNYSASESFINELNHYYNGYNFLRIIDKDKSIKELHT